MSAQKCLRPNWSLNWLSAVAGQDHSVDNWKSAQPVETLAHLGIMLQGAAIQKLVHKDKDEVQIVLTLPEEPSKLADSLPLQGPYCARLGATDSAFTHIAREAQSRLVIVTPFIDRVGAEWISGMFKLTADKPVERILILRDCESVVTFLQGISSCLDSLSVKIFDYHIRHEDRRLPYETFHAKFVLGDDNQAYIGSANMLESSLDFSLEAGVLLRGQSVLDIKRLVESILAVAKQC